MNTPAMKVLAVEDDAVARRVLGQALTKLGYEVELASDGQEAWEKLQEDPMRIVVSDWLMPNVDGLELCRMIRARENEDIETLSP